MRHILLQIILGLVLITAIILVSTNLRANDEPFKKVELSQNNFVTNTSLPAYLDTIMSVGLDNMGVIGTTVVISDLTDAAKSQFSGELKAHVRFFKGVYYLFIDKFDRMESMEVISHEIIHIYQYNSGKLYHDESGQLFWNGQVYDLDIIDYYKRPWEEEAFAEQGKLYTEIRKKLVDD